MSVLSELCLPLVKVGGTFIAMKAASANEELDNGKKAIVITWWHIRRNVLFFFTFEESERKILIKKRKQRLRNIHGNQEHRIKSN